MKAVILGATGYTGRVLLRLLLGHPEVETLLPASSSSQGQPVSAIDPGLGNVLEAKNPDGRYLSLEEVAAAEPEVVFSALPHLKSAEMCAPFFRKSLVIDLSADLRIKDHHLFAAAYGAPPPRPDLLNKAVFGLTEAYEEEVKMSQIIANPGCYPTATLLPLLPIIKTFGSSGRIIVNALSGISGAGRKPNLNLLFTERVENCGAYNPGRLHRHLLEIEQELKRASPTGSLLFTPHLVPLKRGMAVTTVVELAKPASSATVEACLGEAYGGRPFIRLCPGRIPETADVRGSNRCDIGWHLEGKTLMLFSVIDNLVKGASGQAVQNMNIRFGFDETAGLPLAGET